MDCAMFWRVVSAAQMAGEPKPCVMKEKWERQLWMPGSRMGLGLELPRGVLSWASRSVNSLHSCLRGEKTQDVRGELGLLVGVRVLPVEVLAHGFGGELRLADVTEIPRQVDRFTWGTGGEERHLPPFLDFALWK
ncbi:hypothetical protein EYF80_030569 [Liparis tanakae]|uniref:Uncharacterized protein n=1 Tax=Liparis tanakae TaxID=230148 RepID=A0A4Z2H0B2_9TELE|nr:hypothetical protein EYF80_030569 [Liparis tanakae]